MPLHLCALHQIQASKIATFLHQVCMNNVKQLRHWHGNITNRN
jgi:hypothetical protein